MIDAPSSTWFTVSPDWQWLIALYFFFGGLAGGCYFLAAMIDLFGREEDRPLARRGYYVVLPCLLASAVLLILDLSRPLRLWHLLLENNSWQPMFKGWSPMSIGSWALLLFGVFALLSTLAALADAGHIRWSGAKRLRPPGLVGAIVTVPGALLGLYVAGYTGVLLAVTNRPVWADTPLLGMLLVVSAVSISAALMILLGRKWLTPALAGLHRIEVQVLLLEAVVLVAVIVSLGAVASALLNLHNVLLLSGAVLIGIAAPLVLHWRKDWLGGIATATALVLAGGFLLRLLIVFFPHGIHV